MNLNCEKPEKPCLNNVNNYLSDKNSQDFKDYYATIQSMKKLFSEDLKNNDNIEDILIKVSCVNQLYSTNIKYLHSVARHILGIENIDKRLSEGDLTLIDDIAYVKINEDKHIRFYSFATKYCHLHSNDKYSIYDSYVSKVLCYFNEQDKFIDEKLTDDKLRKYEFFDKVIEKFSESFGLKEKFSRQEIDRYL
ncbi:MAG: hypothetical protein ACRCXQ_07195 [Vagococcus fluvialis]